MVHRMWAKFGFKAAVVNKTTTNIEANDGHKISKNVGFAKMG